MTLKSESQIISARKGFTLIELLVVISIIGMLSSIVLAGLNSARLKARDAAIREEVVSFRTLMEQEYNDKGSYNGTGSGNNYGLQIPIWTSSNSGASSCSQVFNNTYSQSSYLNQALSICNAIIANVGGAYDPNGGGFAGPANEFLAWNFNPANGTTNPQKYSIGVWLPGKQVWLCVGSSGQSEGPLNGWNSTGCFYNP